MTNSITHSTNYMKRKRNSFMRSEKVNETIFNEKCFKKTHPISLYIMKDITRRKRGGKKTWFLLFFPNFSEIKKPSV